MKKRL